MKDNLSNTALRDLPYNQEHAIAYQSLRRGLGCDFPAEKLFSLTDEDILSLPYVGGTKLQKIRDYIDNLNELLSKELDKETSDIKNRVLRDLPYSQEHAVAYQSLRRGLGCDFPAELLFKLSDDDILALRHVGGTKLQRIRDYINSLRSLEACSPQDPHLDNDNQQCTSDQGDPGDLLSIQLSELKTPEHFRIARKALVDGFGKNITVGEILNLSITTLRQLRGVGGKKIEQIHSLIEALQQGEFLPKEIEVSVPAPELDAKNINRRFKDVNFPSSYRVEQDILLTACGNQATVEDVLAVDVLSLRKLPGVGRHKCQRILDFLELIRTGAFIDLSPEQAADDRSLISDEDQESSTLEALEPLLITAMDEYIAKLSDKNRFVFCNRHGIDCPPLTLKEVGATYPGGALTRERIRQLQKPLERDWPLSMGISRRKLWNSVQEHLSQLKKPAFSEWKSRFDNERAFFDFLALSCGKPEEHIRRVVFPKIQKSVLDPFWIHHSSPAPLDQVVGYLIEETGMESAVAENSLVRLGESGGIRLVDGAVSPGQMSKPNAVAHTLLLLPDGASWEEIHQLANEKKYSRTPFPMDRMEGGIQIAVDNGWIYQSGRGSYRHISFTNPSEDDIAAILVPLKTALNQAKQVGRDALNLMVDFYNRQSFDADYFTVRHYVRTYGEQESIFFNGKSGADTVSLDSDFSLVGQQVSIVDYIASQPGSVALEQIVQMIRSQSLGHAITYCENLVTHGRLVKVQESVYDTPDKAFANLDIDTIVKAAATIIERENRIIEGEIVRKRLNRMLELQLNKYLYLAMFRLHAPRLGFDWHYSNDMISKKPMELSSIPAIVRNLVEQGYEGPDRLLEQLEKYVLADPQRAQNAISNVIREFNKKEKNDNNNAVNAVIEAEDEAEPDCSKSAKPFARQQRRALRAFAVACQKNWGMTAEPFAVGKAQAYALTWFLRFCALRYLEVNGYLSHPFRMLSAADNRHGVEILDRALSVVDELKLDRRQVEELKLSSREEELYRTLLLAQCFQLHESLPFLFADTDDPSYLYLPENLLRTDSLLRGFIDHLPDEYWRELLIINEIYNVAADVFVGQLSSYDVAEVSQPPAIPGWLAQSMAENSLGRFLLHNQSSPCCAEQIEYFIGDSGDKSVFQQQGGGEFSSVNPENIRVLDTFSGSGASLVAAYRLLREVYLQSGYRKRDIPQLILTNNLFASVCDSLSEKMTRFSLLMSGRSDDRRLLLRGVELNVAHGNTPSTGSFPQQFDVIVTLLPTIKSLFGVFTQLAPSGFVSSLLDDNWMFESRYEVEREQIYQHGNLVSLLHVTAKLVRGRGRLALSVFQSPAAPATECEFLQFSSRWMDTETLLPNDWKRLLIESVRLQPLHAFSALPDKRMAYWVDRQVREVFRLPSVKKIPIPVMKSPSYVDNKRFVRLWHEVNHTDIFTEYSSGKRWHLCAADQSAARYSADVRWVVDGKGGAQHNELSLCCVSFSSGVSAVKLPENVTISHTTGMLLANNRQADYFTGVINSAGFQALTDVYRVEGERLSLAADQLAVIPICESGAGVIEHAVQELIDITEKDKRHIESEWLFNSVPWLSDGNQLLSENYAAWLQQENDSISRYRTLIDRIDRNVDEGYGIIHTQGKGVAPERIQLHANPHCHFACDESAERLVEWLQSLHVSELISYAIGCMMGRYSLKQPGIICADQKVDVVRLIDEGCYGQFRPDVDGIVPLNHRVWFDDDCTMRLIEFLRCALGEESLSANLTFVAESLKLKAVERIKNESATETIRRYINFHFYQDHLNTYQKRPIYWLFTSGRNKAFECLVYMHRYEVGTLSKLRMEYVHPLLKKYDIYLEQLPEAIENASTMLKRMELQEETKKVRLMQAELRAFDDTLRHYADQRISINLDDGVKVNYTKFGDLLAEVKKIVK